MAYILYKKDRKGLKKIKKKYGKFHNRGEGGSARVILFGIFNGENTLFTKNGLVSEKNTLFFSILGGGGQDLLYIYKIFLNPSLIIFLIK